MAITTIDGLLAGMTGAQEFYKIGAGTQVVGRMYSLAYATGLPGAMNAPAGGLQGLGLTTKAGQLAFTNPGAGNSYLARLAAECANNGTLLLCDRLWENSGNSSTSTSAQTHTVAASSISVANPTVVTTAAHGQASGTFTVHITGSNSTPSIDGTYTATYASATTFTIPVNVTGSGSAGTVYIGVPPRDDDGSRNGKDVFLAYEVSGVMGAGTPTLTATYVNSAGTAGQVTPSITLATTMIAGSFIPLPMAAGDQGVRAVASHTKNATQTSGTYHLVLYKVKAVLGLPIPGVGAGIDAITAGFPRLWNDTVPFLVWIPATTTAPTVSGRMVVAQG